MSRYASYCVALVTAIAIASAVASIAAENPYLGRWNLTGIGPDSGIYWLEIRDEGGQLTGMFLNRTGSPVKLAAVKVENGELFFRGAADAGGPAPEYRARMKGNTLTGTIKTPSRTIEFTGARPPKWPPSDANAPHKLGKAVDLVDGKSMDAWGVQDQTKPSGWTVVDGVMTNTPNANNLVSKQKFQDFKIHAEYKLETHSNSGIYLRGRYELQVLDDYGKPPDAHSHMSIYAWKAPAINAGKPAGEWQTMDATLVGNKVTVIWNGQKVHDNATLEAITGGALDAAESEPGPIMIQGDHEKVTYRKVTITPIVDGR